MGPISWIIFGGLAGWVASMIMGTNERQGCLMNVVVGVVGAFVGGVIVEFLTGTSTRWGFNLASFGVAVLGAIVLLWIVGAARKRG